MSMSEIAEKGEAGSVYEATDASTAAAAATVASAAAARPPISPIRPVGRPKSTSKFPPPPPDLHYGYHHHDVLSGRGATINAHPGNRRFRDVCAARKPEFDAATHARKREIAVEIVEEVGAWDPPGRFLERADGVGGAHCPAEEVDAFFREVDVDRVLVGVPAIYFSEMGLSQKRNRRLKRELGPWKDMGMERAVQKACGVIRDHKRPDRIALRAMGMLKRKRVDMQYGFGVEANDDAGGEEYLHATDGKSDGDPLHDFAEDDASRAYVEIHPTPNDVILGRGAFINDHSGNRRLRSLALERKLRFESSTPTDRRALGKEIVTMIAELNPPGRFLKRAPYALREPLLLSDGKYQLPPRGLEGPWEVVDDEKACRKAIQVMRDMKVEAPKSNEATFEEVEHEAALTSSVDGVEDLGERILEHPEPPAAVGADGDTLQGDPEAKEHAAEIES